MMMMMLEWNRTGRGFGKGEFVDRYGEKCSIQESSLAEEAAIWLGIDAVQPKIFRPGQGGWSNIELPTDGDVLCSGRMHLTQKHIKALLPILTHFAETGLLPDRTFLDTMAGIPDEEELTVQPSEE